jgi:hypothetical protein
MLSKSDPTVESKAPATGPDGWSPAKVERTYSKWNDSMTDIASAMKASNVA